MEESFQVLSYVTEGGTRHQWKNFGLFEKPCHGKRNATVLNYQISH
jgi:hypothetical protein